MTDFFRWDWTFDHVDDIWLYLGQHLWLTLVAVVLGCAISLPLGALVHRRRRLYTPITLVSGILYTIPSLALFALLVPYFGLSTTTAEVGLVSYTLLILIRNTAAGLNGVSPDAVDAARGMGYSSRQMLLRVEFPLALPAIMAGIRIATVTTIGLVTVTAVIGKGGLGYFILLGLTRSFPTAVLIGGVLSLVLAIAADFVMLRLERRLAPWSDRTAAA